MSKYNFGDTLIKNNRVYIVVGEELIGKEQHYYLQTRSGTISTRSKDQIDNLLNKRGYKLYKNHCNPIYPVLRDFKIGDLIVGRRWSDEAEKHIKQTGIIINIRRKKLWKGYTKEFIVLWSNGQQKEHMWTMIEHHFVTFAWRYPKSSYYNWKHVPVVKTKKEKPVPQNDTQETSQPVSACSFPSVVL